MSIADFVWKDRLVEKPNTFKATTNLNDGTITLERAEGVITEEGTPINAQNMNMITASLSDLVYQTAGGIATAITLTIKGTLVTGYPITFIAASNNSGAATTINGKKLYKPATTIAPNLISGKAYTVWYNTTGDSGNGCFFLKASAEGNVLASQVIKDKTFSNDTDIGLIGTLDLSLLISSNIKSGITINGITGATNVVDTTISSNVATSAMIRAGYKCFINGVLTTGTATEKAAATINPSISPQVISSGQILTGDQTIAATVGTANKADVVAGKTFNSASGIAQIGTATISSLGGRRYATGSYNHVVGTADAITLPFTPTVLLLTRNTDGNWWMWDGHFGAVSAPGYVIGANTTGNPTYDSVATVTGTTLASPAYTSLPSCVFTWQIWE